MIDIALMKIRLTALTFLTAFSTTLGLVETHAFELVDTPGKHLDVMLDGKLAARYMYAPVHPTAERRHETYKPYLHVYNHRGIFIGWNKIGYKGKIFDRWHMKNGDIIHQKFLS